MRASAPITSSPTLTRATTLVSGLAALALREGQGLAVWRETGSPLGHWVWTDRPQRLETPIELERMAPGFLLSPFHNPGLKDTHFLPADATLSFDWGKGEIGEDQLEALPSRLIEQLGEAEKKKTKAPYPSRPHIRASEKRCFLSAAERAIEALRAGTLEKVVLSRVEARVLPDSFDLADAFSRLCRRYPQAHCSLVIHPTLGVWMGASPETLLALNGEGHLRTVALAGTQSAEGTDPRHAAWSQKEIEEQALVCRYIIGAFKTIRLREYLETGPRTVKSGNLLHLRSDFEVDTQAAGYPQLASMLLPLLHPTSATGGMPREAALDFIARNEGYDRGLYAGLLGPVNLHGGIHLWVNLRCMQLTKESALLYAGAGLTASSDPAKEWAETELKLGPMAALLRGT